jgi:hypothetical protein
MNKINKVRKGEVRIYKGMTYVAVPEIKEDHCTGCCFYNEGSCLIRDPDHVDFPDCHDSGMIWMQKEINISDIKEKAIKLAIDAMKPIPICSSPCYSISDNGRMRDRRMTKSIFPSRIIIRRSYSQKVLSVD